MIRTHPSIKLLVATLATAVAVAGGLGAGTARAGTATVTIEPKAQLVDHLLVSVPVTVTCAPFDYVYYSYGIVSIQQLQRVLGNSVVVQGGASINGIVCDNAPHTYRAAVYANTYGPVPLDFKAGHAAVQAWFQTCGVRNGLYDCDFGSAAPQSLLIRG
jgi:hypothetical protein